jgi:hypothetical protein
VNTLKPLADGLWSWPSTIRVGPIALPRRAVLARLTDGSLWVHSPNALDEAVRAEVDALGPVAHVVAPNQFHHAWLDAWRAAYPDAVVHGARGLAEKKPEYRFDRVLGAEPDPAWADLFDQRVIGGAAKINEVAFLHRPSRTLLLTDTCFNVGHEAPFLTRLLMRLNGRLGSFGPTRIFKSMVDDLPEVRRHVLELADAWDFDRVHVAHGEPVETDGRARLRAAWEQP